MESCSCLLAIQREKIIQLQLHYININTNENTKVRELSGEMQPSGNTGEKEAGTGEIQQ